MKRRNKAKGKLEFTVDKLKNLDPYGGFLIQVTYWRPRPGDPDPAHPGERAMQAIYRQRDSADPCPCGSGKSFGNCCQSLPYWLPVCLDPDGQGFSLLRPQSARFTNVPADVVYEFLQNDARLYCTEHNPQHSFWIYQGTPPFTSPAGTFCFGDFELLADNTLMITALSDNRMELLLELVQPLNLGTPQLEQYPVPRVDKPVQDIGEKKRQRRV